MTTQSPDQSISQSQVFVLLDQIATKYFEHGQNAQSRCKMAILEYISLTQSPAPSKEIPQSEVMYRVYARYKGTSEWIPQESSENKEDVLYWARRNNERNAKTFEEGAGREYIAVKETRTYELL